MTTFLTFGETLAQYNATYTGPFREDGDYMLDCAGAESNVAVDLQKLLPGLRCVWVSGVGDDPEGQFILRELEGRLTVAASVLQGQRTGVSYLNHLPDGQHVKRYRRSGSAASQLSFQQVEPHLKDADVLHVTGITPALSDACRQTVSDALDYAAQRGIPVSFDLNFREQLWDLEDARAVFEGMAGRSSIFKLGHDEAEAVWGWGMAPEEYARHFQQMSGGLVVVTRGGTGALAFDGEVWAEHPGYSIEVVDPIGAGDAFVAGLLAGILERRTLREFLGLPGADRLPVLRRCLELANACGALTCTRRGDTAAMPTMPEVAEFIASRGGE